MSNEKLHILCSDTCSDILLYYITDMSVLCTFIQNLVLGFNEKRKKRKAGVNVLSLMQVLFHYICKVVFGTVHLKKEILLVLFYIKE